MGNKTRCEAVVIPIEFGRQLKVQRQRTREKPRRDEAPAMRRLVQCVEMLAELTREVALSK